MIDGAAAPLFWAEKIIALAIILQTIELLQLRGTVADGGIWSWPVLRKEFEIFPHFFQKILDALLAYPNFAVLLIVQLVSAISVVFMPFPATLLGLLISTILISLRWRGTFNGGSDYMTIIILSAISIAAFASDHAAVTLGCCWYIAIQTCSSFFVAGVAKLKTQSWRNGTALPGFLASAAYEPPLLLQLFFQNRAGALAVSWLILAFECSAPLAFLDQYFCMVFITVALMFQLLNVYLFGLNRFLFAWAAAYPALFWCSGRFLVQ